MEWDNTSQRQPGGRGLLFQLTEYAVDPVGVDTVRPSACTVVIWCSSPVKQQNKNQNENSPPLSQKMDKTERTHQTTPKEKHTDSALDQQQDHSTLQSSPQASS